VSSLLRSLHIGQVVRDPITRRGDSAPHTGIAALGYTVRNEGMMTFARAETESRAAHAASVKLGWGLIGLTTDLESGLQPTANPKAVWA
jgi:hypothetical protein